MDQKYGQHINEQEKVEVVQGQEKKEKKDIDQDIDGSEDEEGDEQQHQVQKEQEEVIEIVFEQQFIPTEKVLRKMTNKSVDDCVWFGNYSWAYFEMPQLSRHIRKWTTKGLGLTGNYSSTLFKDISTINFTRLMELKLDHNKLYSFDFFPKITLQSLKFVDLERNQFTQVKGLRKANVKNLTKILLKFNKIIDFSGIIGMNCPNLQEIFLLGSNDQKLKYRNFFLQCIKLEIPFVPQTVYFPCKQKWGNIVQNRFGKQRGQFFARCVV